MTKREIFEKYLRAHGHAATFIKIEDVFGDAVYDSMDAYMEQSCLELLEYVAKHNIGYRQSGSQEQAFYYKGEWITREQLFKNFL